MGKSQTVSESYSKPTGDFFLWKGFKVENRRDGWYVIAPDGELLASKIKSALAACECIDSHIRRGGK